MKLLPGRHEVEARHVDDDIALNFDGLDRLVGIEVLDASKRLDLRHILPIEITMDRQRRRSNRNRWERLKPKLLRMKDERVPVETKTYKVRNRIKDVGDDYVVLETERTGGTRRITRRMVEGRATRPYILRALRELSDDC